MKQEQDRLSTTISLASKLAHMDSLKGYSGEILDQLAPGCGASWAAIYRFFDKNLQMTALWKASIEGSCQLCQTTMPLSAIPLQMLEDLQNHHKIHITGTEQWDTLLWLPDLPTGEHSQLVIYPFKVRGELSALTVLLFEGKELDKKTMKDNCKWIDGMMELFRASLTRMIKYHKIKRKVHMRDTIYPVIAHDLRGAVGSISMLLEAAADDTMEKEQQKELLELVQSSSREAYYLLDKLLLWSRSREGKLEVKPQSLDVTKIIYSTMEILQVTATTKGVELKHQYPPLKTQRTITTDPEMLGTVLRNLVSNALKFTSSGGVVSITFESFENPKNPENNSWQITVSDTGRGMQKEELAKLLDQNQYFSSYGTKGEKGSGLGFILARRFAQLLGCSLEVESQWGEGTVVTIKYLSQD